MPAMVDYSIIDSANKWRMLKEQWRFALWSLWISSGLVMQGYDLVGGGQLAALPQFQKKFGILEADGSYLIPAHYLSAWSSIGPACEIVATFIFAPLLERFGRKPGILIAAFISAGGVLLQQLAGNWRVHLAGRGINGIAIGMMFTISPLWIGETCRPELRGFFLCFFNTSIVFGQFAMQWWLPVVSMYIFPLILISGWLFFPESPYWLIRQGKTAQGRKSLKVLYGFKDESFYDVEIKRMEGEIRVTRDLQGDIDARHGGRICGINFSAEAECFRGTNLKRTLTAIFAASAQQLIGATFVIGYATYFLELIGVNDYFNASVALYVVMLLASMAAFPLTEIVGRRTLIVGPQFALCAMLLLIGFMGCIPNRATASWGIVAFIYVWAIIYQLSIGATGFVLASELATMRLRGATQGLVTISNAVWGLIMQFTVPYMINPDAGNLGGKVGFIFLGAGLIAAVGGFFLYPETKGIPFEKLDELFALKVNPRHFKQKAKEMAHIVTGEVKLDTRSVPVEQIAA
ncbi:general substrate transporter [Aspergillus novoparasiticus]|uniref:General substrate transporter n=1 Tax=Aspergillus novoparasiticus TaxID=986946 RepID=A0A5N6F529_9EURO|nr:general substrate transporter [Aspergillus novoparasiticus]